MWRQVGLQLVQKGRAKQVERTRYPARDDHPVGAGQRYRATERRAEDLSDRFQCGSWRVLAMAGGSDKRRAIGKAKPLRRTIKRPSGRVPLQPAMLGIARFVVTRAGPAKRYGGTPRPAPHAPISPHRRPRPPA